MTIDSNIVFITKAIEDHYEAAGEPVSRSVGISSENLKQLEDTLSAEGVSLPIELRDFLVYRNGDEGGPPGRPLLHLEEWLYSGEEIELYYKQQLEFLNKANKLGYSHEWLVNDSRINRYPEAEKKWIPIMQKNADSYYVDMNPSGGGLVGQVILMMRDEGSMYFVCESMLRLFEYFQQGVKEGLDSPFVETDDNSFVIDSRVIQMDI